MALFTPPPLPPQRRPPPPPTAPAPAGSAGAAAGTSTAQAFAPFGAGAAAGTSTAAAVGAALKAGVGSSSGNSTAAATASTGSIFPLSVDASGRYLKQAGGTPFLICGDSTWSIGVNIPLAAVGSYLSTATGQGFNAVLMNAIEHNYSVVKAPKERGGLLPFTQRLDGATYTGSPNGTPSASGTQGQFSADAYSNINTQSPDWTFINNSYWQAIETVLDACLANNVLVLVWPGYLGFHGNQEGWISEMVVLDGITGAGGFTGQSFANGSKSKLWNYGAWLADRWKARPNIVWVMGGDFGSGGQALNTAESNAVSHLMEGLKSVSGAASTLYTAHWDRPCISSDTALAAGSFDLNFCYGDDASAEISRRGYADSLTKPAFFGEGFYEDGLFGGSTPYRRYLYWGFLGGIAGGFYGHEQLWRFDDGTPGTDYTTLLATTARLDAQRQFSFFKSKAWHRLKPNGLGGIGTLITAGGGTASPQSTDYVAAAATPEGDLLLAYVPPAHTGSVTVDMTKLSATAVARWFDPTNSTFTAIGAFNNSSTHAFTTPGNNNAGDPDWLLLLETSAGAAAGTSTAAAVGASLRAGTGAAAGTGTAAAVGQSIAVAVGTSSGTSTAAASSGTVLTGAGAAAGSGIAAAVGAALAAGAGTSAGIATVTATGAALGAGAGSAAGTAIATAVGAALDAGAGATAGGSTATAIGAALAAGTGATSGSSTAAATGRSVAAAAGTSAGSSTAAAFTGTLGAAAGSSTATAVGAALAAAAGTAAGAGTAAAVSPSTVAVGSAAGSSTLTAAGAALAAAAGAAAGHSTAAAAAASSGATVDPFVAFEDAIYRWVVAGSGLSADHVIWAPEATGGGPTPPGTYISMRLLSTNRVSSDWMKFTPAAGGFATHVRGTRHPTLELTCFAGARDGAGRTQQLLERVITVIKLPSVQAILRDGNVGIGKRGPVRVIPGMRDKMFDPRSIVEVGLHTEIDVSEQPSGRFGSSIEHTHVTMPDASELVVDKP